MAEKLVTIALTHKEAEAVRHCLMGEIDNDDGYDPTYFEPLRRAQTKIEKALHGE